MRKILPILLSLAFFATPALAETYVTLTNVNLRSAPDVKSERLDTSKRGWLLHGSPVEGGRWLSVYEFQKEWGNGYQYVHLSYPAKSAGHAYVSSEFAMAVPEQPGMVAPGEDAYTPAFDSEGCVPLDSRGEPMAGWANEFAAAADLDFSPVFLAYAAKDVESGIRIGFTSMKKQEKNPWAYDVAATVEQGGRRAEMGGTLTLKKAAAFEGGDAAAYRNVATGKAVERMNTEVRNGFASADLVLGGGRGRLAGVITAYFRWLYDWDAEKLTVRHFKFPEQFIKDFQNPYFSGEWK